MCLTYIFNFSNYLFAFTSPLEQMLIDPKLFTSPLEQMLIDPKLNKKTAIPGFLYGEKKYKETPFFFNVNICILGKPKL